MGVEISGRVLTPDGRGLRNVRVTLVDGNGTERIATTNSFGYYRFDNIAPGSICTIGVTSKNYRFATRHMLIAGNLTDVNFVGLE